MTDSAVRITFVRHGESVANRIGRWQGQGDSPLSELGQEQARRVGARLRKRRFDRVIASDLSRASETASATGFSFERDASFREFDVGVWEGLTREEVLERYPDDMERLRVGEDVPLGGGESHATFAKRVDAALERLLVSLEPGQHALVVCHGGVIGTVLAGALGLRGKARWPLWRASNTSISELSFTPEGARLHVFNDTLHLASSGQWPAYEDVNGCVALLAESAPVEDYGEFVAHYHGEESFTELAADGAENGAASLSAVLGQLGARHPAHRVSLSVRASLIRAWIEDMLWFGGARKGSIADPPRGALSHVTYVNEKPQLLDFGVRV